MLTIRLQRTGTKNAASFRIVVAEKASHVSKAVVEILGSYNPRNKAFAIKNPERLEYWISHNTAISPTVNNLLIDKGLLKRDKVKAFNIPKKEQPAAETVSTVTAQAETASVAEEVKIEEAPVAEAPAAEAPASEESQKSAE